MLSEEEKIIDCEIFEPTIKPSRGVIWENAVYIQSNNFYVFIPEKVKEFKFIIYQNNISDNSNDIKY